MGIRAVDLKKRTFNFSIAGVPYKIKTSHDDALVQELVDFVTIKMDQAMAATKNASFQNAAVLTALNIAEELILLKRKAHRELERLEEKTLKLALEIENSKENSRETSRENTKINKNAEM